MKIDFWFEFASTYSYPAAMRIESLAAAKGVRVSWRPFLLGPIFRDQGWTDSPFNLLPVKGRYMWRDLERICAAQDIPLHRPSIFPQNSLLAARVACRNADRSWLPAFVREIYLANFAHGLDISSPDVVAECLAAAGETSAEILASARSQASKDALRAQTTQAAEIGIFGAPTFLVGDELFWGNDRLEDALAWAQRDQLKAR